MRRIEVQNLFNVAKNILIDEKGIYNFQEYNRFKYAIVRNVRKFETVVEDFKKVFDLPEGYPEYENKLNSAQTVEEKQKVVNENKEMVEKIQDYNKKLEDFLNEEYEGDVSITKVKLEDVPPTIETKVLFYIEPMIDEED